MKARAAAQSIHVPDVLLPADHDTIEIYAPDDSGDLVSFEALPPGGRITMKIPGGLVILRDLSVRMVAQDKRWKR